MYIYIYIYMCVCVRVYDEHFLPMVQVLDTCDGTSAWFATGEMRTLRLTFSPK